MRNLKSGGQHLVFYCLTWVFDPSFLFDTLDTKNWEALHIKQRERAFMSFDNILFYP